jgi:hypothetical protein
MTGRVDRRTVGRAVPATQGRGGRNTAGPAARPAQHRAGHVTQARVAGPMTGPVAPHIQDREEHAMRVPVDPVTPAPVELGGSVRRSVVESRAVARFRVELHTADSEPTLEEH